MKLPGLFVALALLFYIALADAQQDSLSQLKEVMNQASDIDWRDLIPLVVESGPIAVPDLTRVLLADMKKSHDAGKLLAYAGGEDAIAALQEAHKAGFKGLELPLCSAVAWRGNNADVLFLINALRPDNSGNWWGVRNDASYLLGVLRAKEATPALESAAKNDDMAGNAAKDALCWMRRKPVSVKAQGISAPDKDVISAIFINGIPRTCDLSRMQDLGRNGVWIRKNDLWLFRNEIEREWESPKISFNIHISPDGRRALTIVDLRIEPGNGYIFDYILRKTDSTWAIWSLTLRGGY